MTLAPSMLRQDIGPKKARPFSDGSTKPKLLTCPKCQQRGVLYWFAPEERGYVTQCIKCGQTHALKPTGMRMGDIPKAGGFRPNLPRRANGDVDATKAYRYYRQLHDLGWQGAMRRGLVPNHVA